MNEALKAEIARTEKEIEYHVRERDEQNTRIRLAEVKLEALKAELAKHPEPAA